MAKNNKPTIRKSKIFNIPTYAQKEEFTSSAACALMVLKYLNKNLPMNKENEFEIWREAVSGSVWHGSRYGLAYALAKRGAKTEIITNVKDEGFEKTMAVYEGVNLDTLSASFNEIKQKSNNMKIKETVQNVSMNKIKEQINKNKIPIVLVDANALNPYMEKAPHWVIIKGYDEDSIYLNDPYSDNTVTMTQDMFKSVLGYENNCHMILANTRGFNPKAGKSKR